MNFTPEQLEIRRQRALLWKKNNPERYEQNMKLYRLRNKDMIRKKSNAWAKAHRREITEKMKLWRKKNPWYNIWQSARQRCTNPKHHSFKWYGGRGIEFLLSKADMAFMWLRDHAGEFYSPSIDRIDNDGPYSLENCHFIEKSDNCKKRALDNWKKKQASNPNTAEKSNQGHPGTN